MANYKRKTTKRKDGLFEIKVTIGTNKRVAVYGKTEAEAKRKAKERIEESIKFSVENVRKLSVETYMTHWLETVKKPSVKPASYDRIEQSLRHQIFPEIGYIQLNALTSDDVQKLINKIISEKSFSTAKKAYNNLNACFKLAVMRGELLRNPVDGVVMPSEKKFGSKQVFSYSEDQIRLIAQETVRTYANGKPVYRYGQVIILLLNTGMRVGEALYLKWKDVHIDSNNIFVHGNVIEAKTHNDSTKHYQIIEQDTPKSDKSTRYIPLNDNAVNALEALRNEIGDNKRVIATKNATIVSSRKIYTTMQRILERCGITDAVDIVHALRHTFATQLIRAGVDIKTVSEILGHSDVSTTMKFYYHVIEEQKHSAVRKLNNIY